jgi:hypothetical protein
MLTAVIIPNTSILALALAAPVAQQAISAGFGLYTNGVATMLLPKRPAGWHSMAVKARHLDPDFTPEAA